MSSTVQITGGAFQDVEGNILASGYLLLTLSQDAQVDSQEIGAGQTIEVPLDSDGNVVTSPAVYVWPNDVLVPSGTYYSVAAYSSAGQLVWGPNAQQIFSTPSPYDIGSWIPGSINVIGLGGGGGITELTGDVTADGPGVAAATLATVNANPGTVGSATEIPVITSDAKGRITATSTAALDATVTLTGDVTGSGAGTVATTLAMVNANPGTVGSATEIPVITSDAKGRITGTSTAAVVSGITALTGDVTGSGSGSVATTLASVNSDPGTVGSSTAIPVITSDAKGRITATSTATLSAITALTGGVTASGSGSVAATLASVNADPGTVGSTTAVPVITSDVKGRITATSTAALGTMAAQNASSVAITGGSVDNAILGAVTPVQQVLSSGNVATATPFTAVSGTNHSSPDVVLEGSYWNGSSAANDIWRVQDVMGSGTNPYSELAFTHTGTSAAAFVNVPSLAVAGGLGVAVSAVTLTTTPLDPVNASVFILAATPEAFEVQLPSSIATGAFTKYSNVLTFKIIENTTSGVTITPNGTEVIDGASSYSLTGNFSSVTLVAYAGYGWGVIAKV